MNEISSETADFFRALLGEQQEQIEKFLEKRLDPLKSDLSSLRSDVGSLRNDLSSLKSDFSSMKRQIDILERQVNAFEKAPSMPLRRVGYYSGVEVQSVSGSRLIRQGRY